MEQVLGNLLRAGVLISAAVVLVAGVFYLVRYGAETPNYQVFRGAPNDLRSLNGIINDVFALKRRGTIQFGIMLLMATPVVRVGLSMALFICQRDRTYSVVTFIVLALLIYSLVISHL
jgi:uncharacterized membrane protein